MNPNAKPFAYWRCLSPIEAVRAAYGAARAHDDPAIFISMKPETDAVAEAEALMAAGPAGKPLFGLPFVVKDNIDAAGMETTAACPAFAYKAERSAFVVARLEAAGANQYRSFRFEANGAIKAAFVFVRMDAALAQVPAEVLALNQAVQVIVLWSDQAFRERSPLAEPAGGHVVLRPEIAALIRAGYDRVMPDVARDSSHALRLAAPMAVTGVVRGAET